MKKGKKGAGSYRTRHLMIYTFLLILVLLYFASRQQRLAMEARQKIEETKKQEELVKKEKEKEREEREIPDAQNSQDAQGQETAGQADSLILEEGDMWSLVLANESHPVPDELQIPLRQIDGTDQSIDERAYPALMEMLDAMRGQGMDPVVCSGYRTKEKQTELFWNQVQEYVNQGHPQQEAEALAKMDVSIPETGEHRLGLAVDIYSGSRPVLDLAFADTPEGVWLREHAREYGFILRYQQDKEAVTGIHYEPWHFRYVGKKAAEYMEEHHLCLEEFYLEQGLYG